jgi:putative ABC transport system substrate-binding protein
MNVRRREFITLLGGAAAWPITARAQQAMPVIGYFTIGSIESSEFGKATFRKGLAESGYVEGRNVAIEYRRAEFQNEQLATLAADLVARRVTVIAACGNPATAIAAKAATNTIPIVFATAIDPVELGLVASLSRPGGNLTGVTSLNVEIGPKRLELLHEVVPTARSMALLVNPTNPVTEPLVKESQAAAQALGVSLHVQNASTDQEIDSAFMSLARVGAGGLVIGPDAFFNNRAERLAALALRDGVPAIHSRPQFPAAGGLMSYGGDSTEAYHLASLYVGRILKGEKPSDLPVQQVTRVGLIINLKTAKALGITVPLGLLAGADAVIE